MLQRTWLGTMGERKLGLRSCFQESETSLKGVLVEFNEEEEAGQPW